MILMLLIYSNAVDDEIVEIVKRHADGYTKFLGIQGEGGGEPQLGTHVWPGINNCIMVAVDKGKRKYIEGEITTIKRKFPGVGIQFYALQLK